MAGSTNSTDPEFQVAPMIDVLLVLLIFFMTITSAQVLKVDKKVKLPAAAAAMEREKHRDEAIVNIRWDESTQQATFVYDDREYPNTSGIADKIRSAKEAKGAKANFRTVIRADKDIPARYVQAAMDACGRAGVSNIAFSTTK